MLFPWQKNNQCLKKSISVMDSNCWVTVWEAINVSLVEMTRWHKWSHVKQVPESLSQAISILYCILLNVCAVTIDICRLMNIHENLRSIIFAYTHVCILKQFEYFNIHIDHLNVMNKWKKCECISLISIETPDASPYLIT